jgi:hypothetical protein
MGRNRNPLIGFHSQDPTLKPWIEAEAAREGKNVRQFLDDLLSRERQHREQDREAAEAGRRGFRIEHGIPEQEK